MIINSSSRCSNFFFFVMLVILARRARVLWYLVVNWTWPYGLDFVIITNHLILIILIVQNLIHYLIDMKLLVLLLSIQIASCGRNTLSSSYTNMAWCCNCIFQRWIPMISWQERNDFHLTFWWIEILHIGSDLLFVQFGIVTINTLTKATKNGISQGTQECIPFLVLQWWIGIFRGC